MATLCVAIVIFSWGVRLQWKLYGRGAAGYCVPTRSVGTREGGAFRLRARQSVAIMQFMSRSFWYYFWFSFTRLGSGTGVST